MWSCRLVLRCAEDTASSNSGTLETKNGTRYVPRFSFLVEARGIEPRSEHDSDTAPTCVDLALVVSLPRRLVSPGSNKPLKSLAAPVEAPSAASPTLRYVSAASGGLPLTQVREAEAYAARASSELACV